jgi:surfactin synthase thioesterase subunit
MDGWRRFSTRQVELHEFDGGHFFVRDNELVWRQLSDVLART